MQAIKEAALDFKEMVSTFIHSRAFLKIASAVLVITSIIPNVALYVTAAVARAFDKMQWADKVEYTRRKFVFIAVEHNIANLANAPLPVLTHSKNLPSRSVIAKGEDREAILRMRTVFLERFGYLDNSRLQHAKVKGASPKLADSMSLGAAFRVMHNCFDAAINSEADLVGLTQQFEGGFDADASAVQYLYRRMFPTYKKEMSNVKEQNMFDTFARLMNLKYVEGSHQEFHFMDYTGLPDAGTANKFDTLANGGYLLTFPKAYQQGHAVVLLKYDFGSYIFDPEYGLMPIKDSTPTTAISTLIKSYQDLSIRCQCFGFTKA